jgi:hypothetical protein
VAHRAGAVCRKKRETVKLREREKSRTGVAEYLTGLPPGEVLAGKVYKVLEPARLGSDSLIQIQLDKKIRIC